MLTQTQPNPLAQFGNAAGVAAAIRRACEMLQPPPDLKPSEWAEANVRVPLGNAIPGPIRFANAPYQIEPLDQLTNPDCYRTTLMWGAQVGKTMLALCAQGYSIDIKPTSQMMMQPSQGDLTTWLETKFNPLVESNQTLRRRIAKPRGRDGVNNQKMKSYAGGFLMFAWSGSPKTMRGRSAPFIVCDEVDGYEATKEGHPVSLLWQRAATFGDQRFLLEISTPAMKDFSYIEKSYLAGDQRRYFVRCPDCEAHQVFQWENVRWTGRKSTGIDDADNDKGLETHEPETARYVCEACGSCWDDGMRIAAIRTATAKGAGWKAAKAFKGHASYHLTEMHSTLVRLGAVVQSYLDKLANDDLQTFVNVSLSQTWAEKGEKLDPESLKNRAVAFRAQVPAGGLFLTAGIDMQMDRLEVEVVAWGLGEESWSVDYQVLWGDPLNQDVWDDLTDYLAQTWQHESGAQMAIGASCLDTGGTNGCTQAAYDYAKGKTGRRLFAIKGQGGWGLPVVAAPQRRQSGQKARKVDLFMVGVDEAKLIVTRRLQTANPGPGYCHFPDDRGQDWYDQITAEKLITRYEKGFPIRKWTKGDHARNEALDCRVYALAALKITNPSLKRLALRLKMPEGAEIVPFKEVPPAPAAPARGPAAAAPKTEIPVPAAPEKPHEETNTPERQTVRIKRSTAVKNRRGFVHNY
jgi:phage terminase large subunit GpA-like protein